MADVKENQAHEAVYSLLFESSPNPIALIRDGRYVDCNPAFLQAFGLQTRDELLARIPGLTLSPGVQPGGQLSPTATAEYYAKCLEEGEVSYSWSSQRADGTQFPASVTLQRLDTSGSPLVVAFVHDTTTATRVRQQLDEVERRFESLASHAPAGIFIGDAIGRCVYANPKTQELCGVFDQAVLGMGWATNLHPEDRHDLFSQWRRFVKGKAPFSAESRFVMRDQSHVWVSAHVVPFERNPDGRRMFLGSIVDITKIKHIEAELEASRNDALRANSAKSEFLSRMSHELRTPLNAVLGFGQLLRLNNPDLTGDQREAVDQILAGGQHLLELIEDVLDLSRIETGQLKLNLKAVSTGEVIRRSVALVAPLATEAGIQIDLSLESDMETIADPQRLQQVLMNLLGNSIKYSNRGGKVAVRCEALNPLGLRIHVCDDGPGIPIEHQHKIFVPFERAAGTSKNVEGTGIGLGLCKQLMLLMNGSIDFSSAPGKGSDFWIDLPVAPGKGATLRRANTGQTSD